jgi:pimeloyl-ACP methyl ester carboxylesterase
MVCSLKCFLLLFWAICGVQAFLPRKSTVREPSSLSIFRTGTPTARSEETASIKYYEYNGWNLTYRYKAASPGYENASPLLLVHPVGIGLCSWFWDRFLQEYKNGPAVYAPNLIGCGVSEGGDAWDPDDRGLSFPLGWAQGCEALMQMIAAQQSGLSFFNSKKPKWTVISQGGLAPVAVMLAARNPEMVGNLVMASPPTWKDMTIAVPEKELARNYNFLRSPILGKLAFDALESRKAVEFFSNQFLFSEPCDASWLDNAEEEMGVKSRPPVMAFNAGFCQHRSFEEELRTLPQPTLILAGEGDKRKRQGYTQYMKDCRAEILPGLNVLPWESTSEFAKALMAV